MALAENKVTALIGPSGCGKSTLLRCFNRMHDLYAGNRYDGEIIIFPGCRQCADAKVDAIEMRMRMSMVFQKPESISEIDLRKRRVGLRVRGVKRKGLIDEQVERALTDAAFWREVKDRLQDQAYNLSGGQQQRLCIARALAVEPEILLFDEPTSALDPIATASIEELIAELRNRVTILIVTHNMQQAARVSDYTAFMYLGELVEFGAPMTSSRIQSKTHGRLHHRPLRLDGSGSISHGYATGRFRDHFSSQFNQELEICAAG